MKAAASTPQDSSGGALAPPPSEDQQPRGKYLATLALAALGVVYGDIGTSPLYALRECFGPHYGLTPRPLNVLGILSVLFWSLILIVSGKYLTFILRMDNRGEGGILSLMALVLRKTEASRTRRRIILITLALFGASLLYGEGVITPAISVLSAVEGLNVATHIFEPYIIPIALVILVGLFLVQRHGTARVGAIFGPFTLVWFLVLAGLGIYGILRDPSVLRSVNPMYAVDFFLEHPGKSFFVLASVFLCLTGCEALYADMGHFGARPIRLAWFALVLPALLLNYFGQGALLLQDPSAAQNPFFLLAPKWMLIPLVIVSTAATVIASQAMISGAFSLTRQAVQLGYMPRVEIIHTSAEEIGQIYVPTVNWALLLGVIGLVLGFRSSSNIAAAYGIGVSTTMVTTSVLSYFVLRHVWGWSRWKALPLAAFFLLIEVNFWGANLAKFEDGGWFPVLLAIGVFTMLTTWKKGRQILAQRLAAGSLPLDQFLEGLRARMPHRVPGTAVFMTGNAGGTPSALLHNLKHNKVLHERVVFLTILNEEVPHVPGKERLEVTALEHGFFRVVARYGFMETPSVPEILGRAKERALEFKLMETTFFLGRETLIPTKRPGMALWREALFSWMSQNARSATSFFRIPPNRVVELGAQVEL